MKTIPDSLLVNLKPMQRCGVIFSALSRGDTIEADRLADTAPVVAYTAADFYSSFTRAMLVAALARGDIEQQTASEWANRCFWATMLHNDDRDDEKLDTFWTAASYHRTRAGSLWVAYAQAVTDAGMDPAEVMRSMGGLSKLAQEAVDACTDAEPDSDAVELYAAMLRP